MGTFFAQLGFAIAFAMAARYYIDFIARDPYNFDRGPSKLSKLGAMTLLFAPFLLLSLGVHASYPLAYNGVLSLAVSSLVVPAIVANRTGEGLTWVENIGEKAIAATMIAAAVSFLTTTFPALSWYGILVALGGLSMWSRRLLLYVSVQDTTKPDEWNEWRCRAMRTFITRATISYCVLAFAIGALVHHSYVGVGTWNEGVKQLWEPVRDKIFGVGK